MTGAPQSGFEQIILDHASASVIGARYSGLEVLSLSGRFSIVFRAVDKTMNRLVVLKFLRPGITGYRADCFRREAQLAELCIGRENIIQIASGYETFNIELVYQPTGTPVQMPCQFYALEHARSNFSGFLFEHARPRALFRRLEVMRDVIKGVNRLHNLGYCHRDLKPDNILIFSRGRAKIGDLGTCRLHSGADPLTPDYQLPAGDLSYAAPEMFNGGGHRPDLYKLADWFGVGAIMFEAVTGQNLYVAIGLRGPNEIVSALAIERTFHGYAKRVAEIAGRYPVPSTVDFEGEEWLGPMSDATHRNVTALLRDLCHFDFTRRLADFSTIIRRLDICLLHARRDSLNWRRANRGNL